MRHPDDHIFQHTPDTLKQWCVDHGMPAFRAAQILEWVYQKGVVDPDEMTNLSKKDRDILKAEMTFLSGAVLGHQLATDGTQKLLIQWEDGDEGAGSGEQGAGGEGEKTGAGISLPLYRPGLVPDSKRQTETVMIPTPSRKTACVSSQVGCPVGCKFCASGLSGLDGSLTAGRIVEQVWRLSRLPDVGRITNVVFMGMGEPLANFAAVTHAVRTMAAPWGLGISARKITISTVGLHQAIEKLAREFDLPVTLALSLHAPDDALRRQLIPWANFTSIEQLLNACSVWFKKTGREITLEYTLLRGVNDQPEHAMQLVTLVKRMKNEAGGQANVNLIRYNEVKGMPFERPNTADVHEFQEILRQRGVNVHIRKSRGRDIAAACGQLRHETEKARA
ncbi:MAG: 23S rRNA (adenine(2503)-C(2))-methyltransferase RlmN [Phycisphaeraceae bacterium]|nr:23S rRNA (adenine(2503)-C(2))-methyltransferase RlmN [Phycisphaeraceae bacterium]